MRTLGRRRGLVLLGLTSLIGLGVAAAGARGQTAYLVTDLSPGEGSRKGTSPSQALAAGNRLFFLANPAQVDQPGTEELWVTDGTAAGTQRLPDSGTQLLPGPCTSDSCGYPTQLIAALGGIAFLEEVPNGVPALWRTDGTRGGTFPLPTAGLGDGWVTLGGKLYFLSESENGHAQLRLWRTDGTVAGTSVIADLPIPAGGSDTELLVAGAKLFFLQSEPGANGVFLDLWASDGTAPGTARVSNFSQTLVGPLTAAGNRLFFVTVPPPSYSTSELWVSDGTKAGTKLVTHQVFSRIPWVKAEGNQLYFEADDGTHGLQIWRSDGTAAGTRQLTTVARSFGLPNSNGGLAEAGGKLVVVGGTAPGSYSLWVIAPGSAGSVADLCPGGCGYFTLDSILIEAGGRVLFAIPPGAVSSADSLWTSDGTAGGTVALKSCSGSCFFSNPSGSLDSFVLGGTLYFTVQESDGMSRLWRTDGTPGGTARVAPTPLDPLAPLVLASLPGKVFFNAPDKPGDVPAEDELFVTDGTVAGTRQLTDTTDPLASSPAGLVAAGGGVFFTASSSADPATFWRSAGTAASTVPTAVSPAPGMPPPVAAFGGLVYLQSSDSNASLQLWRSDGTAAGTLPLTGFSAPQAAAPAAPVACGTGVCFGVVTAGGGGAVWRSDGTLQGTGQLFTLPATVRGIERLAVRGNDYYLEVDNQDGGVDFWQSDGTAAGTVQLTDFQSLGGNPRVDPGFVRLGNLVYFIVGEPGALWQTDGTRAGTVQFQFGNDSFIFPSDLAVAGGALLLFADGGTGNFGLWRTDGTAAGTSLLQLFQGGSNLAAHTGGLTPFGNGCAFYGDDGVHGSELWITDGTPGGTRMVRDILPGSVGANPTGLVVAGARLYFAADDGIHGNELWESDGTAASTRMVQDIDPGPAPSNPSGMTVGGGLLFFSADDGLTGQELWALPLAGSGECLPSATALCVAGRRFKVEAFWRDFQGNSGAGQAQPLTGDTGTFWFFSPDNVELIAKVLDGRALDGDFWVFYGALSNVEYSLTVTDSVTGLTKRYFNPLGELASVGDTAAFGPMGATGIGGPPARMEAAPAPQEARGVRAAREAREATIRQREEEIRLTPARGAAGAAPKAAGEPCQPGPLQLCLNGGRFAVTAKWTDFQGNSGTGTAVALTGETGYFWFFAAANVETVLKVIDGRGLNGHFWVFYGALSDVQYTLTVTDTVAGTMQTYTNPAGQFASVADTAAF
jgi:ELWxxDGT repeat protein